MKSIHKYLGLPENWPVRDNLQHTIVLMPTKEDIKKANKSDPQSCALHNAACRMFNVSNCAIGGRIAYIPQKDEKGNSYIGRFSAPQKTQAAIKKFDRRGIMPEGGFVFRPVAPSNRLGAKRKYYRLWYNGKVGGQGRKTKPHRRSTRCIPFAMSTAGAVA